MAFLTDAHGILCEVLILAFKASHSTAVERITAPAAQGLGCDPNIDFHSACKAARTHGALQSAVENAVVTQRCEVVGSFCNFGSVTSSVSVSATTISPFKAGPSRGDTANEKIYFLPFRRQSREKNAKNFLTIYELFIYGDVLFANLFCNKTANVHTPQYKGAFNKQLLQWESNTYYKFLCVCVCVRARARACGCTSTGACRLTYPACHEQAPYCLRPLAPTYFSTFSQKWHNFPKNVNIKCLF